MLKNFFIGILVAAVAVPAAAQLFGQPELLEPEKAFRISARALDERNVEVEFKIADGYYMYRDRFSFANEAGKQLAEVEIPGQDQGGPVLRQDRDLSPSGAHARSGFPRGRRSGQRQPQGDVAGMLRQRRVLHAA
jgi:hypothetical protein